MSAGRKRRYSIRRRVAVLVGFGVLAPIGVALWALWSASGSLASHLLEEHQRLAQILGLHFDQELRRSLAELSAISALPEDWQSGNAQRALRAAFLRSATFEAMVDVGADRKVLWQENRHDPVDIDRLLALDELALAMQSGREGIAHLFDGQRSHVVLLVPARDWNGEVTHVVCAVMNPASTGWVAMLDRARLTRGLVSVTDAHDRALVSRGLSTDTDDIIATARLTVVPWQIVIRQPRAEALGPLVVERSQLLVLLPLLFGVALFFAWGATRSVTVPLGSLALAARRIADGNLETAVPPQGKDEIGKLAASLESMRVALKRSLDDLTTSHQVLEQRVLERTRELRLVLTKFVSAQEDERKRIARELHDETCQTIAALAMKLDAALAAPTAQATRERLTESRAFAARTLAEVHDLIYELRPSVLDDLGLFPAIRWLAEHHLTPAGVAFRCEVTADGRNLPPERETTLFRAVQEAIRNVARHAGATQVLIQVEAQDRQLVVEVEDDGHGFDPASVAQPVPSGRGLGLLGMRERLALIGGSVEIVSSSEEGTRVVLRVPFEEEEEHLA
jgi:signal transduction histidine kinase